MLITASSPRREPLLALIVDSMTFLVSAVIIYRLPIPRTERVDGKRIDWTETFREVKERYITADFPAWTILGVASLARPNLLIEIKAVAAAK